MDEHDIQETIEAVPAAMPGFLPGVTTPFAFEPWRYRQNVGHNASDLHGFHVEATDGQIGKVESVNDTQGAGYLVVDTGPWIFGRKVVIPAGAIDNIGYEEQVVYVDRTRDQVKSSPEGGVDDLESVDQYYRSTYQ